VNTECKAVFAVGGFHNASGQFRKNLRGVLIVVSLSVVVPTYNLLQFFFKEIVRYPVWICRDPIYLVLGTR